MATTVGSTRRSRARGRTTKVRGQPPLQRGGDGTGQVDRQRDDQGGQHGQRRGQPEGHADDHHDHLDGGPHHRQHPQAPGPGQGRGPSPAGRGRSAPTATTAGDHHPGDRPAHRCTGGGQGGQGQDQVDGSDAPPADGEPGHRPGQIVLALGDAHHRRPEGTHAATQQPTVTQATPWWYRVVPMTPSEPRPVAGGHGAPAIGPPSTAPGRGPDARLRAPPEGAPGGPRWEPGGRYPGGLQTLPAPSSAGPTPPPGAEPRCPPRPRPGRPGSGWPPCRPCSPPPATARARRASPPGRPGSRRTRTGSSWPPSGRSPTTPIRCSLRTGR